MNHARLARGLPWDDTGRHMTKLVSTDVTRLVNIASHVPVFCYKFGEERLWEALGVVRAI